MAGWPGFINGLLGISGPLSSAVFLTLGLSPVAYIVSRATAAAAMHIVKAVTYGKFDLMNMHIFLNGFFIGCAMMLGNFIAASPRQPCQQETLSARRGLCDDSCFAMAVRHCVAVT